MGRKGDGHGKAEHMKLEKLAFGLVVKAEPHESIRKVAGLMAARNVGSVVITSRSKVLGIVTDRDVAAWVGKGGSDAGKTHIGEIMTKFPLVAAVDDELEPTLDKMAKKGVHRIPIVSRKGDVVGVLSTDDALVLVSRYMSDIAAIVEKTKGKKK